MKEEHASIEKRLDELEDWTGKTDWIPIGEKSFHFSFEERVTITVIKIIIAICLFSLIVLGLKSIIVLGGCIVLGG